MNTLPPIPASGSVVELLSSINLIFSPTFLLLPLYTHSFSQEEYGTISLAYAFIGFALILYRYGMDTALMKFSDQTSGVERTKHISIIVVSQNLTGIIFTTFL